MTAAGSECCRGHDKNIAKLYGTLDEQ